METPTLIIVENKIVAIQTHANRQVPVKPNSRFIITKSMLALTGDDRVQKLIASNKSAPEFLGLARELAARLDGKIVAIDDHTDPQFYRSDEHILPPIERLSADTSPGAMLIQYLPAKKLFDKQLKNFLIAFAIMLAILITISIVEEIRIKSAHAVMVVLFLAGISSVLLLFIGFCDTRFFWRFKIDNAGITKINRNLLKPETRHWTRQSISAVFTRPFFGRAALVFCVDGKNIDVHNDEVQLVRFLATQIRKTLNLPATPHP